MRKLFFGLCLGSLFWQFGCGGSSATNENQNTANTAQKSVVESNSNTAVPTDAPLPKFTDAETALAEGNKLFDINKNEQAIEAYKQAVELNPELGEAWFKLGIAYSLIEKEKELEAVNEQTEYTPTPTPSKKEKQIVRTKDSEKAFENAVKAYKKTLAKNPKDDVAHYNLGRTYNKLDEDEDALKSLREAVKLKSDSTEYQTELGAILIKLAQYDEAVRALKKALELDPENSQAEELLEKAEAGKKRINFGVTPRPQQTQQTTNQPRPKSSEKPKPEGSPAEQPKAPESKLDKKGNQ